VPKNRCCLSALPHNILQKISLRCRLLDCGLRRRALTILGVVNSRRLRTKSEVANGLGVAELPVSSSHAETRKGPVSPEPPELSRRGSSEWSGSARQYDAFEKKWHFYGTVADALIRQLPIMEDSRVLELACGTGVCTLRLAKIVRAWKVVALDFSEGMLDVTMENIAAAGASNVVFVHGDAGDVGRLLEGQRFDFALCNSAFWHFPEPEKVLAGLRELLTESAEFTLSLPSWVDGNNKVREAFRAKAREARALKHGVAAEEIERVSAQRPRERVDLLALFDKCGFVVREVTFEFKVSLESRGEWRRISAFSDRGRWAWSFPNLDPAVQKEVREELDEWRKTNFPRHSSLSRWRIFVASAR
jgi:SAM-dependent methyltransferase